MSQRFLLYLHRCIGRRQQIGEHRSDPGERRALRPVHAVPPEQPAREQGKDHQHGEETQPDLYPQAMARSVRMTMTVRHQMLSCFCANT